MFLVVVDYIIKDLWALNREDGLNRVKDFRNTLKLRITASIKTARNLVSGILI